MKTIFYLLLFTLVVFFAECTPPMNIVTGEPCQAENGWHYLNNSFGCVDSASAIFKMRSVPVNGLDYFTSGYFYMPIIKTAEALQTNVSSGLVTALNGIFAFKERNSSEVSSFINGQLHYHMISRSEKDEWKLIVYKEMYSGQKYFTTYHLNSRLKTVSKVILTTLDSSERLVVKELRFDWWMREINTVQLNGWKLDIVTKFKYWQEVEEMVNEVSLIITPD